MDHPCWRDGQFKVHAPTCGGGCGNTCLRATLNIHQQALLVPYYYNNALYYPFMPAYPPQPMVVATRKRPRSKPRPPTQTRGGSTQPVAAIPRAAMGIPAQPKPVAAPPSQNATEPRCIAETGAKTRRRSCASHLDDDDDDDDDKEDDGYGLPPGKRTYFSPL